MEPRMQSHKQNRLDPITIREVLRGLRHMVKQGGETLKAGATPQHLPEPAAAVANSVIDQLMGTAHRVNARATIVAKVMIGTEPDTDIMLNDLARHERSEAVFAATVYAAMKIVLKRMNMKGVFVSETAAKRAFAVERSARPIQSGFSLAASLTFRLLDVQFLHVSAGDSTSSLPNDSAVPVAIFAVILWLQSPRQEDDQEAALLSAVDLSLVLAGQIVEGCKARDSDKIGSLYGKYVANV